MRLDGTRSRLIVFAVVNVYDYRVKFVYLGCYPQQVEMSSALHVKFVRFVDCSSNEVCSRSSWNLAQH